ncbi:MAG: hypothetical protein IJK52_10835 [Oscillospiraceae bacterium]|nr:hypothetical protein [Oscillospiraceae bacterium]
MKELAEGVRRLVAALISSSQLITRYNRLINASRKSAFYADFQLADCRRFHFAVICVK